MSTNLTPNMALPVPVVGEELGPQWAIDIDACFTQLDGHDHSPGSGVQITPAGLNINTDLSFSSFNATLLRSSRYSPQLTPLALASDLGCMYVSGVDLYYNDVNGNQIRLTQGGAIVGTAGSITGLVPPASASYNSFNGSFIWQSDTNIAADMDFASAIMRKKTALSAALTLEVPSSLSSDYVLVLPALPGNIRPLTLDPSGNISTPWDFDNSTIGVVGNIIEVLDNGITEAKMAPLSVGTPELIDGSVTTPKLLDGNVTPPKLAALNVVSSSAFTASTSSSSYTQLGSDVTITTSSRPIMIMLIPDPGNVDGAVHTNLSSVATPGHANLRLVRNGGPVVEWRPGTAADPATGGVYNSYIPPGSFCFVDTVGAGVYNYLFQGRVLAGAGTIAIENCRILVYEMA